MGFLKPKPATSSSSNQAYGQINTAYSPSIAAGTGATNFLAGALGVPGGNTAGADAGFAHYKDEAGYAPALHDLQAGITQGAAAQGLLNSGSTQKALVKYGAGLDSQMFGNYLQSLTGLSNIGQNAGNTVVNAGQTSSSSGASPSTAGAIAGTIGGIASIFSDRRTKRDITHLHDFDDGLGLYAFRYLDDPVLRIGVMADEVQAIRPWAMGPKVGGFDTVNYGAL
jgi:hypothetical protein